MRKVRDVVLLPQEKRPLEAATGAYSFDDYYKRRKVLTGLSQMATLMSTAGPLFTRNERAAIACTLLSHVMAPSHLMDSPEDEIVNKTILHFEDKVAEQPLGSKKAESDGKLSEPSSRSKAAEQSDDKENEPPKWWEQIPSFCVEESPPL